MILSQGWVGEAESALDLSHSHLPLLQGVDVDPESVALQLRIYIDVAHPNSRTGSERIQKCRRTCSTSPKTVSHIVRDGHTCGHPGYFHLNAHHQNRSSPPSVAIGCH